MTRRLRGESLLLGALLACSAVSSAGCRGRSRAASVRVAEDQESSSGPAIAVLDLSGRAPEKAEGGWLGLSGKGESFPDLLHQVDLIGRDKSVRGVLVRLGTAKIGLARAGEIGRMLSQLGKTIPVFCHADQVDNTSLYLAALGCKQVWVSPASSVDAIGIAAQMLYFHKLLADQLGLSVDFLQVGKFKGAEEPFTRDGPSPEARESLESTLAGLRAGWLAGIHEWRISADESAAEDGPYTPQGAKGRGLIDDVGYFDDARSAIERAAGVSRSEVRFGPGAADPEGTAIAE
ncbi:MAG: S49 family peptidase, partial [Polyangiaceae bacterium]